ncbi:hypothetical protein NDU88_003584 [Pleurodeles waltl]|uniref:Uncharacterized protein n=1 Tax=Pleurodeles waltl TaxID=8319 RepID=A0AAV7V1U8_PLEWA|nr:hypothetical protein NDU88_003584 [Pleurodeles waltl]
MKITLKSTSTPVKGGQIKGKVSEEEARHLYTGPDSNNTQQGVITKRKEWIVNNDEDARAACEGLVEDARAANEVQDGCWVTSSSKRGVITSTTLQRRQCDVVLYAAGNHGNAVTRHTKEVNRISFGTTARLCRQRDRVV